MVNFNIPITLTKVSKIDRNLGETVKSSNINFFELSLGDPLNKKYTYLDKKDKYMIMVSKNQEGVNPDYGYNLILTITSYSNKQNEDIANNFQDETEIELKKAPESLEKMMNKMGEIWINAL